MEVLDDDILELKKGYKIVEVVPVLVLGFFSFISLVFSVQGANSILLKGGVTFFLTIILFIVFWINRKVYFYGTLIFIFFHTFIFFHLGWSSSVFSMSIGPLNLSFKPLSLVLFIFHLWIFNKELNEIVVEKKKEPNRLQVEKLKKSFQSKSEEELEGVIRSDSYRTEAKIAAEELLKEYKKD